MLPTQPITPTVMLWEPFRFSQPFQDLHISGDVWIG